MSDMKHITIFPENKLRSYIQYYWIAKDNSGEHLQISMADGFTCIRFFRGGEQTFLPEINTAGINKDKSISAKSGILGPRISCYGLMTHNKIETIGVKFTMLGAKQIFGENICYLSDKFTTLSDYNDKSLNSLENNILNTPSLQNCISYMDDYFWERLKSSNFIDNNDNIIKKILEYSITSAKLSDLANVACCSVRTLNRVIDTYTGLTPKQIIRIARLSTTIKKVIEYTPIKDIDLKGLATDCGFYDLSHMTKEMKALCGYTPLQFITIIKKHLKENNIWSYQQGDTTIWGKVQESIFNWCKN